MKNLPFSTAPFSRRDNLILASVAALSLLPALLLFSDFRSLFWFGDDLGLLNEIREHGLWKWTWLVFAENFVPVFKILWGGAVFLFKGSYLWMLLLLWLTHAFNTYQFGRLLKRYGFPWLAVLICQLVFGLTPANIETLCWSTQWSAVMATSFFLVGLEWVVAAPPFSQTKSWKPTLILFAMAACSALSFSRGVLTGAVFALACFWPVSTKGLYARRCINIALFLLPAIVVAALIAAFATGNHKNLHGHLLDAADFGLWYFIMNPLHRLAWLDSWGIYTFAFLGTTKMALIVWGLLRSDPQQRVLLVLLLAFDLGNATLLGIGRYHTGLGAAISSRYQYSSMITLLPFAALWISHILGKAPGWMERYRLVKTSALVLLTVQVVYHWPGDMHHFAETRGRNTRYLLFKDPNPPESGAIPGISFMSTETARELTKRYNLH